LNYHLGIIFKKNENVIIMANGAIKVMTIYWEKLFYVNKINEIINYYKMNLPLATKKKSCECKFVKFVNM
jgi:hypothetical protein